MTQELGLDRSKYVGDLADPADAKVVCYFKDLVLPHAIMSALMDL